MARYLTHILVGIDQLANAALGGWPDETISARAHRQQHKPRWARARRWINALFFWQDDHCQQSYLSEQQRRQLPPSFRDKPKSPLTT